MPSLRSILCRRVGNGRTILTLPSPAFLRLLPSPSLQFAIGWWIFIDAVILSKTAKLGPDSPYDEVPVHINFGDWVAGILATRELASLPPSPPPSGRDLSLRSLADSTFRFNACV